ncbi:RES family NAD+ phosphorylase [Sinorhizobium medicae]|uniref:RES domain-containing protein n=2 Tax=Sinorhizobium medicae TaxID=110321 RepID=A0ABX4TG33_9HYPH|nr:RES family NAD+ phosphorylase [Sinorhizobium medicae]PLT98025.1 hypothetical protein BMJ33_24725 [Sinorhizobium medicae]PLU81504.1 hypothetical protein BMJ19_02205 [Sinorhizobium medicae]
MCATRFEDVNGFWQFENEVTRQSRYVRSVRAARFLDAVVATCPKRLSTIGAGTVFWRAQIGHRWTDDVAAGRRIPLPHPEARMKPWDDRAYEGRVNPKGIPCLYFATDREAAMSEVRPGIGSVVSVARFEAIRDLVVVDCSRFAQPFDGENAKIQSDDIENLVWSHIDYAFSRPVVRSDNTAGYAATQILAEVFKAEGYDGIIYKTAFSHDGHNVALFDLNCASFLDASLFRVREVQFMFEETP